MALNVYEEVVIENSDNEDDMIENGDSQENSDTEGNFTESIPDHYIEIAPECSVRVVQKKRGRPPKEEVERQRLAALYHGSYNSGSNGISVTPTSQKKRGRPPKSDSEKNNRPKNALRIALGSKTPKVRRADAALPNTEASPFPLVQQADAMKKSRGRPRIHPPKDNSVKRPRGRPRLVPLEGEAALRSAFLKLKRDCAKKDAIIKKLKERLEEFGHPVEDIFHESKNSEQNEDSEEQQPNENESYEDARMTPEPSSMEDTHQTYIGMFADTEDKNEESEDDSESE